MAPAIPCAMRRADWTSGRFPYHRRRDLAGHDDGSKQASLELPLRYPAIDSGPGAMLSRTDTKESIIRYLAIDSLSAYGLSHPIARNPAMH